MICLACNGDGWLRRLTPHPGVPGKMVTVTKPCRVCNCKGRIVECVPSWKDRAAGNENENNPA